MSAAPEPIGPIRAELGESPVWDPNRNVLWFVDILGRRIHRYDPAHSETASLEVPQEIGAVVPRRGGGLVAAVRDGIAHIDDETGAFELITPIEADRPANRMNDAKCDRRGRLWAGTMAFEATPTSGTLYRYDPDRTLTVVLDGLSISNGLGWSGNDRTMYFVDSASGIDRFDFDLIAGTLENRRRLITIPSDIGLPDGMTIDSEDHLWVAIWGGSRVQRYTPEGRLDREIQLPASHVTSVAFAGPTLKDLYITTARVGLTADQLEHEPLAGACFVCQPGLIGTQTNLFNG